MRGPSQFASDVDWWFVERMDLHNANEEERKLLRDELDRRILGTGKTVRDLNAYFLKRIRQMRNIPPESPDGGF